MRYNTAAYPGVAQLVARVVWDHEAAGSIPVTRTRFGVFAKELRALFLYFIMDSAYLKTLDLPQQRKYSKFTYELSKEQIFHTRFATLHRTLKRMTYAE